MQAIQQPRFLAAMLLCAAALVLATAREAAADGPYFAGYWPTWQWSVYLRENVPYYALNPPVYYSIPVARPYGYSPFAYPSWVKTPEIEAPRPAVIQNPYVSGCGGSGSAISTAQVQPLRIQNPYVK